MIGWYSPEAYYYNKNTDVLKKTLYVDYERYFVGDDWAWSEKPELKVVTSKKERMQVFKQHPELIK